MRRHRGQSANLQEWQDSSGTVMSSIPADGKFQSGRLHGDDWYRFVGFPGIDGHTVHVLKERDDGTTIGSVPANWCVMDAHDVR